MSIAYGGDNITFPDASTQNTSPKTGFVNRIINGSMTIDQRNEGASVTPGNGQYTLDRWQALQSPASKYTLQQNAGAVTPPAGFVNYLGITSTSAYTVTTDDYFTIEQYIEGSNISDLAWGTASAQPVTISFRVRSSLTGTFGGVLRNGAANRTYPFTYTITSSNTWETKTITIPGDTSGTWTTNNTTGVGLFFGLGVGSANSGTAGSWSGSNFISATGATSVVGTNGATFYITGVQLEKGSTATPFEFRSIGQELTLCYRYYYKIFPGEVGKALTGYGTALTTTSLPQAYGAFPVPMRIAPSALEQTGTASDYSIRRSGVTNTTCNIVPSYGSFTTNSMYFVTAGIAAADLTAGVSYLIGGLNTSSYLAWSAEL
jgi:hypothetical protein